MIQLSLLIALHFLDVVFLNKFFQFINLNCLALLRSFPDRHRIKFVKKRLEETQTNYKYFPHGCRDKFGKVKKRGPKFSRSDLMILNLLKLNFIRFLYLFLENVELNKIIGSPLSLLISIILASLLLHAGCKQLHKCAEAGIQRCSTEKLF